MNFLNISRKLHSISELLRTYMQDLHIAATKKTPEIHCNVTGTISIKGISTPENVTEFYQPLFQWLDEYKLKAANTIHLIFDFDYLNTSTTSIILRLLRRVVELKTKGLDIHITWKHEDDGDDMAEQGSILQDLIQHPIKFQLK